jgi:hypothetical protein
LTPEQRQQLQTALQTQRHEGAKEIEGIRQTGANTRTREAITGRHQDVAAQQAGATSRNTARINAPARVAPGAQLREDILRENVEAEKLLRQFPDFKNFVNMAEDGSIVIKPIGDIKTGQRDAYKDFLSKLGGAMERAKGESSIEYEYEDEGDESLEDEEP